MRVSVAWVLVLVGCVVGEDPDRDPETGSLSATWGPYDPQPGHPTAAERDAYPYPHYPTTTINFMNDYRTPGGAVSAAYNLYKYSPAGTQVWIAIDAPAANGAVSGDATIAAAVGGGAVTSVKFSTRATGALDWYDLGEDATAPFAKAWATDPWVANGSYQIKAEAYAGSVLKATGTITVTVANP